VRVLLADGLTADAIPAVDPTAADWMVRAAVDARRSHDR
jgi:hypothetical protein